MRARSGLLLLSSLCALATPGAVSVRRRDVGVGADFDDDDGQLLDLSTGDEPPMWLSDARVSPEALVAQLGEPTDKTAVDWSAEPDSTCFGAPALKKVVGTILHGTPYIFKTATAGQMAWWRHNRASWAERHGWRYCEYKQPIAPRSPTWDKLPLALSILPHIEVLYMMDIDMFVTNPELPPDAALAHGDAAMNGFADAVFTAEFTRRRVDTAFGRAQRAADPGAHPLEPRPESVVTREYVPTPMDPINAGAMMLRNTPWTLEFLAQVYADFPDTFNEFLADGTKCPLIQCSEQSAIESWREQHAEEFEMHAAVVPYHVMNSWWARWAPGDMVVHFAGRQLAKDNFVKMLRWKNATKVPRSPRVGPAPQRPRRRANNDIGQQPGQGKRRRQPKVRGVRRKRARDNEYSVAPDI